VAPGSKEPGGKRHESDVSQVDVDGFGLLAALTGSCDLSESGASDAPADVSTRSSELTAQQRLTACAQDPRVVTGLATAQLCAGAGDLFF